MKTCSKCGATKMLSDFYKRSDQGGIHYRSHCKSCTSDNARKYSASNMQAITARTTKNRRKNPALYNDISKKWKEKNREKVSAMRSRLWSENPEKHRQAYKTWYQKDGVRERRNEYLRRHRQKAPHLHAHYALKRRISLDLAMPKWASVKKIGNIYLEAKRLSKETGIQHVVDHIVPLRSKVVCGLHSETNLRVITAAENKEKSNRWWPDMPEVVHAN